MERFWRRNIASKACAEASCSGKNLDKRSRKLIEVTIEGWENRKFYILPEDANSYPYPGVKRSNSIQENDDITIVMDCIEILLLDTWKATAHGFLIVKSQKNRNGNIEVLVGTTPMHRYFIHPYQINPVTGVV
jgi:hypothetical protein